MKKRILLTIVAIAALAIGIVGMSAYEAHVINVTATIENALSVPIEPITFGTVFPQEELNADVSIAMSNSFIAENRAESIDYVIKQKPKCGVPVSGSNPVSYSDFVQVTENGQGVFVCPGNSVMLPLLCPYLSKHNADNPVDQNDGSLAAFHGPLSDWTDTISTDLAVVGRLAKSQNDTSDKWNFDLKVPCFAGQCAQDWNTYVTGINPQAVPANYIQPTVNEHKLFGCDLWMEVTDINRFVTPPVAPSTIVLSLENKHSEGWFVTADNTHGTLEFNSCGTPFEFNLTAQGLTANTNYSLIYYADGWPGNNPGALIWSGSTNASGEITVAGGSATLGIDIPNTPDTNYPTGGKIWLIPSSAYDSTTKSVIAWPYDPSWLFEFNTVRYSQTCPLPPLVP